MALTEIVSVKPYTKVVNFSAASATTMTLTDTAGNPIMCNYIECVAASSTAVGTYILVSPSGVSPNPLVALANGASGTIGGVATPANPFKVVLPNSHLTSSLYLSATASIPAVVTYGVAVQNNPLRNMAQFRGL